ncbi:nitrate reductase molybdenum cofactor assembly chaperone [Sphaerisporangium krabiense]|uniref:Nitrate reductase delta subunit n=1 Tax=Sphaerisporangium krabiense TaxID=763782 RepID=A0A7W8Z8V2_9ACTN|nr:nitrate reductase molybdenum cofactor assembly chaperone [Sphaerisporangium krabiense]MBB5629420.1 nitrate reductase delta subunit [Sphaerisporangium krabiense]GII65729.1 nitrate reductase molybdenum cofactor assembly chaperone [Sphaerisporangium krabiense]
MIGPVVGAVVHPAPLPALGAVLPPALGTALGPVIGAVGRLLPGRASGRAVHQAASLLLTYPGADWQDRLALVRRALAPLRGAPAATLRGFCAGMATADPLELAADYVATFDRSARRTLHMTYYTDGDTRRRGGSLAEIKALYRAHGWRPDDAELPDFLPLMLEFAARCPRPGAELLRRHRPGLDVLQTALRRHRSPYADVVAAVAETLPPARPGPAGPAAPPAERVGLDPFPAAPAGSPREVRR